MINKSKRQSFNNALKKINNYFAPKRRRVTKTTNPRVSVKSTPPIKIEPEVSPSVYHYPVDDTSSLPSPTNDYPCDNEPSSSQVPINDSFKTPSPSVYHYSVDNTSSLPSPTNDYPCDNEPSSSQVPENDSCNSPPFSTIGSVAHQDGMPVDLPVLNVDTCAKVVIDLNIQRLMNKDYRITNALSEAMMDGDNQHYQEIEWAWGFLNHLTGENSTNQDSLEAQFMLANASIPASSELAMHEMTTDNYLYRIYLYIKFLLMEDGEYMDQRIELFNGIPLWALVYYAFRCGKIVLILNEMAANSFLYDACPLLADCLDEYISSPDRCLSQESHAMLQEEGRNCVDGDPYKTLLIQLITRSPPSSGYIINTRDDFIWMNLTLLDGDIYGLSHSSLKDYQEYVLLDGGTNQTPFDHFNWLLSSLQFENAIDYLYRNDQTRSYAVHFAIALMYYVGTDAEGTPTWNMKKMIELYLQSTNDQHNTFQNQYPEASIHYLFLLTIYSRKNGYPNDNIVTSVLSSVRRLVSAHGENFYYSLPVYTKELLYRLAGRSV
ncbi:Nup93/Nic96-domain-containing protein [Chlamydoabsidia padenii]|nr:Nup93/Nic96-domain-containing protein [Chlamydoabsidia padenii]